MNKTLIGKNEYLFLINDSCRELEVHNDNLCIVANNFYNKYILNIDKFLLIVFPNKSYIYKQYLPDNYNLQYRPAFDKYKNYLKKNILDGYDALKDKDDCYYKTDTHINLKGAYIVYKEFVNKINQLYNLNISIKNINIENKICNLSELQLGIGDLTWEINLGNQILNNTLDNFYYTNDMNNIYTKYKINIQENYIKILEYDTNDITHTLIDKIIDWTIISKYILYKINPDLKYKVLIFYDSFLLSTLELYLTMFNTVYVAKTIYNNNLIQLIKPDYIFEFRCERFLN